MKKETLPKSVLAQFGNELPKAIEKKGCKKCVHQIKCTNEDMKKQVFPCPKFKEFPSIHPFLKRIEGFDYMNMTRHAILTSQWYYIELPSGETKIPKKIINWIAKRIKKDWKKICRPFKEIEGYTLEFLIELWYSYRIKHKHPNVIPRLIGEKLKGEKVDREYDKRGWRWAIEEVFWEINCYFPKLKFKAEKRPRQRKSKPKPKPKPKPKQKYPIEKWKGMKAQGMSLRQIAEKTGYPKSTIYDVLSEKN